VRKSDESMLPWLYASIDNDEMLDQRWGTRENPVLGLIIKTLFESNSISFLFVSNFILLNNLLWNMDTNIVEFGFLHDEIFSFL
jgi:hypothetical protein